MTFRKTIIAAPLLVASALAAHQGASGVVKERMDAMGSIAANMKSVGQMLRGSATYDPSSVAQAMQQIAAHAEMLPHKFPEGSNAAPSEAAPLIWTETEEFNQIFEDMRLAAEDIAALAEDQTAVQQAFGKVAATCKACHEKYRLNTD